MKMVKSLLLGSAAGLLAVVGAQAADLPVKAKAVEYVKVCSLYGAGFYYIPGTDTCLKVGGYVRAEVYWDSPGGWQWDGGEVIYNPDRAHNDLYVRSRGMITLDARSQTEYGTLRSYIRMGAQTTSPNGLEAGDSASTSLKFDLAFIQLAGFTIGKTVSYFDIYSASHLNHISYTTGDSVWSGLFVAAYTAQFGNGVSATLSFEDPIFRNRSVFDATAGDSLDSTAVLASSQRGTRFFDVVGSLRIDQAWGYAAVTGALHDISATYYTGIPGHPSDEIGFAVAAGAFLKVPGMGPDTFGIQVSYGNGALGYVSNASGIWAETDIGLHSYGILADGVYVAGSDIEKTRAWSINAGYEHWWVPGRLRTSINAGYLSVSFSDSANASLCTAIPGAASCDLDWSLWQVGSRTVWTPVQNLDLSIDVLYTHVNSGEAVDAGGALLSDDVGIATAMFRAQRNFWP